ncbi:MAG: succinate dehydrogenase assembly factor 2 [Pseudomonadota bacterium]|nr:succinate dehydrogenase assembly factor 2 [Pseudomonadota bacterium]
MSEKLEIYKKKILYRASYRGTKEMDILLSSFVKKHINNLDDKLLKELEKFLEFDDQTILNYYNHNIVDKKIDKNSMSKIFKNFKV